MDESKTRWSLLDFGFLADVVEVMREGAKRPGRETDQWRTLPKTKEQESLYFDACMRHLVAASKAADIAQARSHLSAVAANAMIMYCLTLWRENATDIYCAFDAATCSNNIFWDRSESSTHNLLLHLTRSAPKNPVQRSTEHREKIANAIDLSASKYSVHPFLVAMIIFRESSFSTRARGKARNEVGLMQVHGRATKGCELETVEGQIDCGTSWFRKCLDKCESEQGALTMYASGSCKPRTIRTARLVQSRMRLFEKLKQKF